MRITDVIPHLHTGQFSDLVFVELRTSEPGLVGWGECSLPGKPHAVAGAIRDLARLAVGQDAAAIRALWQRGYRHGYWRGGAVETSALAGLDIALWDIAGKQAGRPVHALLGGAVRSRISLYANCGLSVDPDELAKRARGAIDAGFRLVKIYPLPPMQALPPSRLIDHVRACCGAVRDAIGREHDFAIDLHGRPLPAAAVTIEAALRDLRPAWIEEPVPSEDEAALRIVRRHFATPIALGERLFTRWAFRRVLEEGLADIIQPDIGNAGGISELRVLAEMAEAHSVAFCPHSPNGLLHTFASLHAAAIAQTFGALEYRPAPEDSAVFADAAPAIGDDGCLAVPESAGIGTVIVPAALAFDEARVPMLEAWGEDGAALDW
jgi:galactonate dehydratase